MHKGLKLKFIFIFSFFILIDIQAFDLRYNFYNEHYVKKGETLEGIIEKYFSKEDINNKGIEFFRDQVKSWNTHIDNWNKLPVNHRIYLSRPASPFLSWYKTSPKQLPLKIPPSGAEECSLNSRTRVAYKYLHRKAKGQLRDFQVITDAKQSKSLVFGGFLKFQFWKCRDPSPLKYSLTFEYSKQGVENGQSLDDELSLSVEVYYDREHLRLNPYAFISRGSISNLYESQRASLINSNVYTTSSLQGIDFLWLGIGFDYEFKEYWTFGSDFSYSLFYEKRSFEKSTSPFANSLGAHTDEDQSAFSLKLHFEYSKNLYWLRFSPSYTQSKNITKDSSLDNRILVGVQF